MNLCEAWPKMESGGEWRGDGCGGGVVYSRRENRLVWKGGNARWNDTNCPLCELLRWDWQPVPAEVKPDFTGDLTPGQATCAMEAGLCVQNRDVCLRIKSKCVQVYGAHRGWYDADDRWTHRQIMRGSYRVVPDPEAAEEAEREPITLLEPVTVKRGGARTAGI